MNFVFVLGVLTLAIRLSCAGKLKMKNSERKDLLDKHNSYRAMVAKGYGSQPKAANMVALDWDSKLAGDAAEVGCKFEHTQGLTDGQNLGYAGSSSLERSAFLMDTVTRWFNEVDDAKYNYATGKGDTTFLHYTQVVAAKTTKLGCSFFDCSTKPTMTRFDLACNYNPAGNWGGEKPYIKGQPCSKCPSSHPKCLFGALCATEKQCKEAGEQCGEAQVGNQECEDKNKNCESWASSGECKKNSIYMKPNCCLSCLKVLKKEADSPSSAYDDVEQNEGLSNAQRQLVLDLHNMDRAKVARGEIPNQPSASNMIVLNWDDRLAKGAQEWASKCRRKHDTYEQRAMKPYRHVGQNWVMYEDKKKFFTQRVEDWFSEHKEYSFPLGFDDASQAGHYTQMVWAKTQLVGCGLKECDGSPWLFCNYAVGGNYNNLPPYKKGSPCSDCPNGYNYCMAKALCATKAQCGNSKSCKCLTSQSSCGVKGKYIAAECRCVCKKGWGGLKCDKKCSSKQECEGVYTDKNASNKNGLNAKGFADATESSKPARGKPGKTDKTDRPQPYRTEGDKTGEPQPYRTESDKTTEPQPYTDENDKTGEPENTDRPQRQPYRPESDTTDRPQPYERERDKTGAAAVAERDRNCRDHRRYTSRCNLWAKYGQCVKDEAWMAKNCCYSCKRGCQNVYVYLCDEWARFGECKNSPKWMDENCCRSCSKKG